MGNYIKTDKQVEQLSDAGNNSNVDEMTEIEKFIRKKRLQNQVLEKLSKKIDPIGKQEEEKTETP